MARTVRVLACQLAIPPIASANDRDAHVDATAIKLDKLLEAESADLVVLPELSTLSYSRTTFEQLGELAESLDGRSVEVFAELAARRRVYIAFGIARTDNDRTLISQVVVNPRGEFEGAYDKLHMAQFGASMEKEFFSAGDHLLVFVVNGIRVAPVICYDFRFPDLISTLCRKHGVDLVIHPVAFYRDRSFPSWHHIATARAVENQIYYLSLNRAGETFGESIWCPPWIDDELAPDRFGTEQAFRYFTVDTKIIDRVRDEYPFADDRLPDYGKLNVESVTR